MGSIESGIRDLLDLVGKQRAELATLRAENERLRGALGKAGSIADINTDGNIDCALKWVSDIAKEALK